MSASVASPVGNGRLRPARSVTPAATQSPAKAWPSLRYGQIVIATWCFYMLLRRMSDYVIGFHDVNPLTLLPLLAMIPMALASVHTGFRNVPGVLKLIGWTWAGSFLLAFAVAVATKNYAAGIFGILNFGLPMFFAFWLVQQRIGAAEMLAKFSGPLIWIATLTSVYGIFQFVSVLPWDALWMLNGGANGIGIPQPYQVRVFSTLTAPSPYAAFLACTLVLTIARWHLKPFRNTLALVLQAVTLALTLERSCWVAAAIGLAIYLIASPRRKSAFAALGIVTIILAFALSIAAVSSPKIQATVLGLQQRFATFQDVDQDISKRDRQQQSDDALKIGLARPLGFGLGIFGVAERLSDTHDDKEISGWIDNGYLARFTEMGYVGFLGYLAVTFGTFAFTVMQRFRLRSNAGVATALGVSLAIQAIFLVLDVSHDHHAAFTGVLFWLSVAIAIAASQITNDPSLAHSAPRSRAFRLRGSRTSSAAT